MLEFELPPLAWWLEWAPSMIIGTLAVLLVWWLQRPYEYLKDLTDVGYWHVVGRKPTARSKEFEELHVQRTRKPGNRLPPPFPNGWYMASESKDVRKGQAISVDILGENFVIFRTESGEANIFDAYCPHLGANLGVGGTVKGDCIECPFHEWQFRASDGECTAIPYSPGTVPRSVAKLKKWTSCEVNGGIFVWYHAEKDAVPWKIEPIPQIDSGEWRYSGRCSFMVSGHIQTVPENASDIAHLNAIHNPSLFTGSDLRYTRPWWSRGSSHKWDLSYNPSTDEATKHIAYMCLKHSMRFFDWFDILTIRVDVQQVGPGYVTLNIKTVLGFFQILQTYTPVEPLLQNIQHRFFFPFGRSLFSKFIIWGEAMMFERDMVVWNHMKYIDKPLYMKEEKPIRSFRNWFSQFYSPNSKTFKQIREESLEW